MNGYVYYITGSLIFVAVLNSGECLASPWKLRRERFALRFLLCLAAQFVFAFPVTLGYCAAAEHIVSAVAVNAVAVLTYVLMFAVSLAAIYFCYDMPFRECVLSGVAGYAAQHICYNIYGLANYGDHMLMAVYKLGMVSGFILTSLIQLAISAVVLVIVRLFLPPGVNAGGVGKADVTLLAAGTLLVVLVANAVLSIFRAESAPLAALSSVLLICCCVFILFLRSDMLERRRLSRELGAIDSLRAKELRHYEQLRSNMELVNVKCHDIRHYIDSARSGVDLDELKRLADIYDSEMKTGNETLDIILSEYRIYCSSHEIIFTALADGKALGFMSVADICSLFGNILENAVEACEHVSDPQKRVVSLNVRNVAGQISVSEDNYFAGELRFSGGMPLSSKGDPDRHGFGVKSIKMIVEKYGGTMDCRVTGDLFSLGCMIPVPVGKRSKDQG